MKKSKNTIKNLFNNKQENNQLKITLLNKNLKNFNQLLLINNQTPINNPSNNKHLLYLTITKFQKMISLNNFNKCSNS